MVQWMINMSTFFACSSQPDLDAPRIQAFLKQLAFGTLQTIKKPNHIYSIRFLQKPYLSIHLIEPEAETQCVEGDQVLQLSNIDKNTEGCLFKLFQKNIWVAEMKLGIQNGTEAL